MVQRMKIDEQVSVGSQPDEEDLQQLARDGFQTVVNMRLEGEEDQPLDPQEEGRRVRELGMEYVHFPVSMKSMGPDQVDAFREQLAQWTAPVYVHCQKGKRAGACVVMDRAVRQQWTGDETLEQAQQLGFECDVPALQQMVKQYVDGRRG